MKKKLVLLLALVLIAAASVSGTLAYFTDRDEITNTFTTGKVNISLDETDVDYYGVKDGEGRVKENSFRLIPGHSYVKDPIVHLLPDSEASWLFVKIENGLADMIAGDSIEAQILSHGWANLAGTSDVYYQAVPANYSGTAVDYPVFTGFAIDGTKDVSASAGKSIGVRAYAIQKEGFDSPAAAWAELSR